MHLTPEFDLSKRNTLGLPSTAAWRGTITSEADAADLVREAAERGIPLRILGGGSNIILPPRFEGVLAEVDIKSIEVSDRNETETFVTAGAGAVWQDLVAWTVDKDLPGLENLAGIPGTVGAAPIQNIGAYGIELVDRFRALHAFDTHSGTSRTFTREECAFAYRNSMFKRDPGRFIILDVTVALPRSWSPNTSYRGLEDLASANPRQIMETVLAIRGSKLPDWRQTGNVGSFFHNPVVPATHAEELQQEFANIPIFDLPDGQKKLSAAWLIERAGLKGHRLAGAGISDRHALIVVNHGTATRDDIRALADLVRSTVEVKFHVSLQQEPEWF